MPIDPAHWSATFYDFQDSLTGCYGEPLHPYHYEQATRLTAHLGGPARLLELGSGGGQFAVAAALLGHTVTALDLRPAATQLTRRLADEHGVQVSTLTGDFYQLDPGGPYDAVCYWDGFGIGSDAEQRELLGRVVSWLNPGGAAYIEVYTPWYWADHAGFERRSEHLTQTYGFDADGCRLTDTYTPANEPPQTQSLRCYSPADLRLLLHGTPLELAELWPGGHYDPRTLTWHPQVSLGECQSYVAALRPRPPLTLI